MDIALPDPEQVLALLPTWRTQYPPLDALLTRYGGPPKALRHLGLELWRDGDLQGATRLLAGAVALARSEAPFWSSLGGVLFAGSHGAEAASCLRHAVDIDPTNAADWLLLGTALNAGADRAPAERAFLRAFEIDPTLTNAALGLGLLYMQTRRFEESARYLRLAVADDDTAPVHNCLGQVLSNLGDFGGAAAAFAAAVHRGPDDVDLRHKWGQARFVDAVAQGTIEEGLAAYEAATGHPPAAREKLLRDAFHLLSGYGHIAAAIRLGELRLRDNPDDPVLHYLLSALRGGAAARAPDDYVTTYFDKFADTFDQQLVEVLDYHVPEKLVALLAGLGPATWRDILDLGCGTGIAGPLLKTPDRVLTGVDLSARMLDKAAARAVYDTLVPDEVVAYLGEQPKRFDLIFAADVLVYIGDLTPLLRQAARALRPGGLLAASIETTTAGPYRLLPSGRFAHDPDDVRDRAGNLFVLRAQEQTMIRLEANKPVDGAMLVFERV